MILKINVKSVYIFTLMAGFVVLSGCSRGANPSGMIATSAIESPQANSVLRESIAMGQVTGGQATNPLWISEVSNDDFASALRQSLAANALLAIRNETFRVDATLVGFERPLAGFDLTVTARIKYKLTRVASNDVVYDREIRAPFTANFGTSFMANQRLQLANEGAVKENIRQFLRDLAAQAPALQGDPAPRTRSPTARPVS